MILFFYAVQDVWALAGDGSRNFDLVKSDGHGCTDDNGGPNLPPLPEDFSAKKIVMTAIRKQIIVACSRGEECRCGRIDLASKV